MIYLDIDGVMLAGQDYMATPVVFPAARVAMINQLLDATGTKIVLTSTWRRGDSGKNMIRQAGLWKHMARRTADGQICDWKTPFLTDKDDDDGFGPPLAKADPNLSMRGQEIQAHIDAHGIKQYVILDDVSVLVGQHHLPINQYDGLTQDDIDCAIDLWNMQGKMLAKSA